MSTTKNTNEYESELIREVIHSNRGGKEVIERLVKAYGFTTRISLCSHLGVSQSTMANRYARDTFPADWMIICNVDTGASLIWLATGKGSMFSQGNESQTVIIPRKKISNGIIEDVGEVILDKADIQVGLSSPFSVTDGKSSYIADKYSGEVMDGFWLIEIDGLVSIRELYRFPGSRIRIENGKASFECQAEDIKVLGKVISRTEQL